MFSRHRLAEIAALLGDPARAGMVLSLWDGAARPAGELARLAGIGPATASSHLAKLVAGGWLRVEPRGRHRDYRLSGAPAAQALEALAALLPPHAALDPRQELPPIRRARLCYDHLAGHLGVAVGDALLARRLLRRSDEALALTPAGRRWFGALGIEVAALEAAPRPLLRTCLDWTERREHVSGALGAALAGQLLERDWLRRQRGTRALLVTTAGRRGFGRLLGLRVD